MIRVQIGVEIVSPSTCSRRAALHVVTSRSSRLFPSAKSHNDSRAMFSLSLYVMRKGRSTTDDRFPHPAQYRKYIVAPKAILQIAIFRNSGQINDRLIGADERTSNSLGILAFTNLMRTSGRCKIVVRLRKSITRCEAGSSRSVARKRFEEYKGICNDRPVLQNP